MLFSSITFLYCFLPFVLLVYFIVPDRMKNFFLPASRQASSNYGIGVDGRVGMYVEEKNHSWCSSSAANDQRAITIECASDNTEPYAFKNVVYQRLIELCTDICKRNGKTKLLWLGDKAKTLNYTPKSDEMVLTVHRWFANKGAALLQKCFMVDFLTKKRKVNEGEVPQYYVEHSHEPIITPEEFDKVQTELTRRKQISRQYSGKSIFSSRIVCGDCGSYFGSKVWNSTSKYRRVIWQCNGKFKGEHKCETSHLDEETIKARFVTALNAIIESKDNILED